VQKQLDRIIKMELALILVMPLAQAPSFIMESMSSFRTHFFANMMVSANP
jgi:hypothetical protein